MLAGVEPLHRLVGVVEAANADEDADCTNSLSQGVGDCSSHLTSDALSAKDRR